jgi:hypothetical protein
MAALKVWPLRSASPMRAKACAFQPSDAHATQPLSSSKTNASQVMADVYASAVGTTVLQVKEIPPRPARFDGAICLFGLQTGVSKAAVRAAIREVFAPFGSIVNFELDRAPAVVRFSTHDAALKAKAEYSSGVPGLFDGLDTQYNERSYNGRQGAFGRADDGGRGWCVCSPCNQRKSVRHPWRRRLGSEGSWRAKFVILLPPDAGAASRMP